MQEADLSWAKSQPSLAWRPCLGALNTVSFNQSNSSSREHFNGLHFAGKETKASSSQGQEESHSGERWPGGLQAPALPAAGHTPRGVQGIGGVLFFFFF